MHFTVSEYIVLNYMDANEFFFGFLEIVWIVCVICLFCTAQTLASVIHGSVERWLRKSEVLMIKSVAGHSLDRMIYC